MADMEGGEVAREGYVFHVCGISFGTIIVNGCDHNVRSVSEFFLIVFV